MYGQALRQKKNQDVEATKDLLLAEIACFEEAMWRSEETGEKRFNFFITLVSAVAAGLVAIWSAKEINDQLKEALPVVNLMAGVLLLSFGLVTFLRMRHRDRVTDEYQRTTRFVRNEYRRLFSVDATLGKEFKVPIGLDKSVLEMALKKSDPGRRLLKLLKGGYTVSLAVLNGFLLTATLLSARPFGLQVSPGRTVVWGAVLVLVLAAYGAVPRKDDDEAKKDTPTT